MRSRPGSSMSGDSPTRPSYGHGTAVTTSSGAERRHASSSANRAAARAASDPSTPTTTGRGDLPCVMTSLPLFWSGGRVGRALDGDGAGQDADPDDAADRGGQFPQRALLDLGGDLGQTAGSPDRRHALGDRDVPRPEV